MSTVTGRYTDTQGNPMVGTVYISPAARAGNADDIVAEKRVWADLDVNGSIAIDVIPSDDPGWNIDGEMPYLVEERLIGLPFRAYWIGVPEGGVDLSDVQQVNPDVVYVPVPGAEGPAGPPGAPGGGIHVRGTVATWGDLPAAGDEVGDAWFIADQQGTLAVWTEEGSWFALETIAGPEGPEGPVGPEGPEGPQGPPGAGTFWFSVTDYGAVGDGVTDDTAAINAAINAAGENSTLVFPVTPSYYLISETLSPLPGQVWQGSSAPDYDWEPYQPLRGALRAAPAFTGDSLLKKGTSRGVVLRNLSLIGNGEGGTLSGIYLASGSDLGWTIEDCRISMFGGAGICGNMEMVKVIRTHITRCGYGIRPNHVEANSTMQNCVIAFNDIYYNVHGGIYADGSRTVQDTVIEGNRIHRSGVYIDTDGGSGTLNPSVNRDPLAAGIYLNRADRVSIIGNSTDANAGPGLQLEAATQNAVKHVSCVGNQWNRDGSGDNATTMVAGVRMNQCQRITVKGDHISFGDPGSGRSAPQYGVSFTSCDLTEWDGQIQLDGAAVTTANGIHSGGGNTDLSIREARIRRQDWFAGNTGNRPEANLVPGTSYFDTSLGQPIWWDGSDWVDAAGSAV